MKMVFLALALGVAGVASAQSWPTTYSVIYTFPGADVGSEVLFRDSLGRFFGVTGLSGTCGGGMGFVYELRANKTLVNIKCSSLGIQYPFIQDASGNLYGVREASASNGGGVFELVKKLTGGYFYKNIWQFKKGFPAGVGGWDPQGKLTLDSAGNLYGTTGNGGHFFDGCSTTGCGVVYKLSPNPAGTWSETVLHAFVLNTEAIEHPNTDVAFDAAGNLYGSDPNEHIYELSPDGLGGWTLAMVAFAGFPINPGLQVRGDGNLWFAGSFPSSCGGVGYFNPTDQTVTAFGTLPFTGEDGCGIFGAPVFDAAGNAYAVAGGAVVEFDAGTGDASVLHAFSIPGAGTVSGLLIDASGNLYGSIGGDTPSVPTVIYKITNP
jgi:hypothetical protein